MALKDFLKSIADTIRAKKGTSETIKASNFPNEIENVYKAGGKAQYDEFWDSYQENGNRKNYLMAFAGISWYLVFKPKYNMQPTNAYAMFRSFAVDAPTEKRDLVKLLAEANVTLDLSKCTDFGQMFQWSHVSKVGTIDTSSATTLSSAFLSATKLETIECLKVREALSYNSTFNDATELKNLAIEGTIGKNGFNLQSCKKLSKESIISVIDALSSTTSGLTVTLSKTAVVNAYGSETSADWVTLKNKKSNWTVALS